MHYLMLWKLTIFPFITLKYAIVKAQYTIIFWRLTSLGIHIHSPIDKSQSNWNLAIRRTCWSCWRIRIDRGGRPTQSNLSDHRISRSRTTIKFGCRLLCLKKEPKMRPRFLDSCKWVGISLGMLKGLSKI